MLQKLNNNSGSVMVFFAAILPLLLLIIAGSLETGRSYAVHAKAQHAVDAALLGAVSTATTTPNIAAQATSLFFANFPTGYMGTNVVASDISVTQVSASPAATYQMTVHISVPNVLSHVTGAATSTITVSSQVVSGYQLTNVPNLELAMVFDNTSSMATALTGGTTKLEALKQGATAMLNGLFGSSGTLSNVDISVIPYDIVVQIGANHASWIYSTPIKPYASVPQHSSADKYNAIVGASGKGFAMNRKTDFLCGAYYQACPSPPVAGCQMVSGVFVLPNYTCTNNNFVDADDTPPIQGANYQFRLPYENSNLTETPSGGPGSAADHKFSTNLAPMLFASSSKSEITNALNAMQVSGNTRIPVGLMWGWFTLSPRWQGLWDAGKPGLPASVGSNTLKQLILVAGGTNNVGSADDTSALNLCAAIQSQGITIYTIGLGASGSYNQSLLQSCASEPGYFYAASTLAQLQTAFTQITDTMLYVTTHLSQ